MSNKLSRRDVLKASMTALGVGAVPVLLSNPVEATEKNTTITSQRTNEKTILSHIQGCITNHQCLAIPNACIEIWQTKANSDAAPGEKDCYYWEKTTTNHQGNYSFATFLPKCLGQNKPQIHIKISADGYQDLKLYLAPTHNGELSAYSHLPNRATNLNSVVCQLNVALIKNKDHI